MKLAQHQPAPGHFNDLNNGKEVKAREILSQSTQSATSGKHVALIQSFTCDCIADVQKIFITG